MTKSTGEKNIDTVEKKGVPMSDKAISQWKEGNKPKEAGWYLVKYLSNDKPPKQLFDKLWFNPDATPSWWYQTGYRSISWPWNENITHYIGFDEACNALAELRKNPEPTELVNDGSGGPFYIKKLESDIELYKREILSQNTIIDRQAEEIERLKTAATRMVRYAKDAEEKRIDPEVAYDYWDSVIEELRQALNSQRRINVEFLDNPNCAYTTSSGENVNVSISALLKIITELPKAPKLFSMPIGLFRSSYISENFIILSDSVANALEQAIKNNSNEKL